MEGELEVRWSDILVAYISEGILPSDELVIMQTLQSLRAHTQSKNTGFEGHWREVNMIKDPVARTRERQNVIADAILKAKIIPQKRSGGSAQRLDDVVNAFPQLAAAVPHETGLAMRAGGEVVKIANRSEVAGRLRFQVHRGLRPNHVWRAYEIPGFTGFPESRAR
jgi:hypothetical protein